MKKLKIEDQDWSIGRGYGSIYPDKVDGSLSGTVRTPNGFVQVYSQGGNLRPNTLLEFIFNGRAYSRIINRFYSSRYLVTVAKKFAKEIVKKHNTPKISYNTQVLIAIYDFQKEHDRGSTFPELVEKTGLKPAIVSKCFDYLMDRAYIKDDWAIVDGNHNKVIFITEHSLGQLEEKILLIKEEIK